MALVYDVERMPTSPLNVAGSDEFEITLSSQVEYTVVVSDDADPFDPRDVEEFDVADVTGLPIVNKTVYTTTGGLVVPYMICRGKSVKRDAAAFDVFHVSTSWKSFPGGNLGGGGTSAQSPPVALTDFSPQLKFELGEAERVIYIDKADTPNAILTPTRNFYSEPAIEKIATKILTVTQYESSVTYNQLQSRKFKVNDDVFQGDARYDWLIQEVEATEVSVVLDGGPTRAALVTYTLVQSPFLYGWKDDRSLIDTHYFDGSGRKIAFSDDLIGSQTFGFVNVAGARKAAGTLTPDRVQFETFDDIAFDSFLHSSLF